MQQRKTNIIITIILFSFTLNMLCMDDPHKDQCNRIKKEQLNNFTAFEKSIVELDERRIDLLKAVLTNEFESHKESLLDKKQEVLRDVENKCTNKKRWAECVACIEAIDDLNEENKDIAFSSHIHSEKIPRFYLGRIIEGLKKYFVNPERISIVEVSNVNYIYQAKTIVPIPCLAQSGEVGLDLNNICPGEISINIKKFERLPESARKAFLVRMIEDITWNLSAAPYVIEQMASLLTDDAPGLLNSKEFTDLKNFYLNHMSIFLPCLRDPKNIGNMLRMIFECPETPTAIDDYKHLSEIKNCVEKLKAIEMVQGKNKEKETL